MNDLLKNSILEWSSMFIVTLLIVFNVFTVFAIIELNTLASIIKTEAHGVGIVGILLAMNYLIFIRNNRYEKIIRLYSKRDNDLGYFLVILYVVLTIVLFFYFGSAVRDLRIQ